jgi:hypothetical protein
VVPTFAVLAGVAALCGVLVDPLLHAAAGTFAVAGLVAHLHLGRSTRQVPVERTERSFAVDPMANRGGTTPDPAPPVTRGQVSPTSDPLATIPSAPSDAAAEVAPRPRWSTAPEPNDQQVDGARAENAVPVDTGDLVRPPSPAAPNQR